MSDINKFGVIGLGKMGGNLAIQAARKGFTVFGYDPKEVSSYVTEAGVNVMSGNAELVKQLPSPRVLMIYVPAGEVVDKIIKELIPLLDNGDVIMESGNSYWGDSIKRAEELEKEGIFYIDCGTSGGIDGARQGACFMAGGKKEAIRIVEPILKKLAVDGGFVHTGPSGTGHFVKLVHNGIEFGMLQAIGEGISLLEKFDYPFEIDKILHNWNHGSVIRSWLTELMEKQYRDRKGMNEVPPYIEDTGEVNWLVSDAMTMEVPIPIISQSVMELFASRDERRDCARAVAMMRNGFGEHPLGPDNYISDERKYSKVGPSFRYINPKIEE